MDINEEIKYYEEYIEAAKKWDFYDSFKEHLEKTLEIYKNWLKTLEARRNHLNTLRGSLIYTLSYNMNKGKKLNVRYS